MRIAIALCFSAVLCTVYANPTDNLDSVKLQIQNAISNVEHLIQHIKHVHVNIKDDTTSTVTDRMWEQMDSYRDYVDLLLKLMRREVNNAKLRGIDAQQCYDTNSWAIDKHSDDADKAAKECQDSAEKNIQNSLQYFDNFVLVGNYLIQELDDIFVDCHDEDTLKMQSCVLSEFGKVNNSVKKFEEDTKYLEYNALPVSNHVVLKATQCMTNAYLRARFESQGAMDSHSRCVREAVERKRVLSLEEN